MRLALIPPYKHINSIQHTDYQLLLPQCLDTPQYARAYQKARREGHYLILDNGIAEGVETTPLELHNLAHRTMVNEIVIPDTLGDMGDTVQQAHDFHEWVTNKFNYMGVVQGKDFNECYQCIEEFAKMPYITTLGIPRHLITSLNEEARILITAYVRKRHAARFKVHLLGTNPAFMNELVAYGRAYEMYGVRGVDTSAPFNYALAGATLLEHEQQIGRPDNYFEQHIVHNRLAFINLAIMKDWTYGVGR